MDQMKNCLIFEFDFHLTISKKGPLPFIPNYKKGKNGKSKQSFDILVNLIIYIYLSDCRSLKIQKPYTFMFLSYL